MTTQKRALVCGAGGFIGGHLVKRLKAEGYWVRGVDLKEHEFSPTQADDFVLGDLRDPNVVARVIDEGMDDYWATVNTEWVTAAREAAEAEEEQ